MPVGGQRTAAAPNPFDFARSYAPRAWRQINENRSGGPRPCCTPSPGFDRIGEENAFAVLARATELAAQGRDIINLGIGQPDFRTPDHIVEAAVKALRDGHHGYTPGQRHPAAPRGGRRRHATPRSASRSRPTG